MMYNKRARALFRGGKSGARPLQFYHMHLCIYIYICMYDLAFNLFQPHGVSCRTNV